MADGTEKLLVMKAVATVLKKGYLTSLSRHPRWTRYVNHDVEKKVINEKCFTL